MTSPFPDTAQLSGDARLVVEVPHWAAAVALIDNDLKEVGGLGKVAAAADGTGRIEASLPPGAYEAQVTLDGRTQTRWAVLRAGDTMVMPASSWNDLGIETAMPLAQPQPTAGADDALARDAAKASVAPPLPCVRPAKAPEARLSIYATAICPDHGEPADFDLDVQLLDEDGELVADLAAPGSAPNVAPRRMWRCAFDLDAGYYVLRARQGAERRSQPLYLCAGMESHVFLRCDGLPHLGSLSLDMGRLGEGYDPEKDRAVAADAILTALRSPDADRLVLGSERVEELLLGEDRNPWLAVLAAYALLSGSMGGEAEALLADIRGFLHGGPLHDHPDVVALLIDRYPPIAPLRHPPMLRVALQRLSAHAIDHVGAIAPDSPLDRLGNRLIADSAWTAWSEGAFPPAAPPPPAGAVRNRPAELEHGIVTATRASRLLTWLGSGGFTSVFAHLLPRRTGMPAADGEGLPSGAVSLPEPIRGLVRAFPANAPVYPLAGYREGAATIVAHAALIEAAITGLPLAGRVPPAEMRVPAHDGDGDGDSGLLDVSAEAVSRLSGLALDKVIRNFRRLKRADAAAAIVGDLRQSLGTLIATIEARQIGADDGAPQPSVTPVEDKVERLRDESERLRACSDPAIAARAGTVADRLLATADRLLRHAHLVLVADAGGTLRYGNRLLRDRLVSRGSAGQEALERLCVKLAAQTEPPARIAAADLSPTSPEAQAGVSVAVQRMVVRGVDDTLNGYVYYLRDAAIRGMDEAADLRLDATISQITLQVSLIEFGTGDSANRAMARLEALAEEVSAAVV